MPATTLTPLPDNPGPVIEWASQFDPEHVIGESFDIRRDPFCGYLKAIGYKRPFIGHGHYGDGVTSPTHVEDLMDTPAYAAHAMRVMDTRHQREPITAGSFIAILERVRDRIPV